MDDALRPAAAAAEGPEAAYAAQLAAPPADAAEQAVIAAMLGRPPQARSAVAVRCGWGLPAVLRVDPRTHDGKPFPTLFWLACPLASRRVAGLEADGAMAGLTERLRADDELAEAYTAAARRYVAARDALGGRLPGDPAAGGMPARSDPGPGRVKCLHACSAHELATGDNPVGRWVAERMQPLACPAPCVPGAGQPAADATPRSPEPGT